LWPGKISLSPPARGVELEVERAHGGLELILDAGSDDRGGDRRLVQSPQTPLSHRRYGTSRVNNVLGNET